MKGKIIAFEGVAETRKHLHAKKVAEHLSSLGNKVKLFTFPTFSTPTGKMLKQYLNGEFGDISCVSPKTTFLLFTINRLESKSEIDELLSQGYILIMDRYVYSNQAYQATRLPECEREEFLRWGEKMEFDIIGLPKADKIFFIKHDHIEYTDKKKDIHERDDDFMEEVYNSYMLLASKDDKWTSIDCHTEGGVRDPEDINKEIISHLSL